MMKFKPVLNCAVIAAVILPHLSYAQEAPRSPPPFLYGALDVATHTKFSDVLGAAPAAAGALTSGYASVRYSIGLPTQRTQIARVLNYLAQAFPEKFGNSSGTYTVTITISDLNDKLLVKEPILSFSWTKESGFLFIDKTVTEAQQTSWRGTLINQMLLTPETNRLKMSIELYLQKDRSLDFSLLKSAANTFSTGALASYFPLPAAALPIFDAVTGLMNNMYANSTKSDLVDSDEVAMIQTKTPIKSWIRLTSQQGAYNIPIYITVDTIESRILGGNLAGGRFDKMQISTSIFNTMNIPLGDGKGAKVADLVTTANSTDAKTARVLVDAVSTGATYGKDPGDKKEQDVSIRCAALYGALNSYLSTYDARAMFYAFVRQYGTQMNENDCLGPRADELAAVGLAP